MEKSKIQKLIRITNDLLVFDAVIENETIKAIHKVLEEYKTELIDIKNNIEKEQEHE